MLLRDPLLSKFKYVMIDEAHERTIDTDICCALLKRVLQQRPDFKLIVTSATLDADAFDAYFTSAARSIGRVEVEGRSQPVQVRYLADEVEDRIGTTSRLVIQIHAMGQRGDILVFVPGVTEIEKVKKAVETMAKKLPATKVGPIRCIGLHAGLPKHVQSRSLLEVSQLPAHISPWIEGRKVIIATNVAETSLTIPRIAHVVDSTLAKVKTFDPKTDLHALPTSIASQAQMQQRGGRTGRDLPGTVYYVCTRKDFETRPPHAMPTILSGDMIDQTLLLLRAGHNPIDFDYLTPPSMQVLLNALDVLMHLGCFVPGDKVLTNVGKQLADWPFDPRYGKAFSASVALGCSSEVLSIIAMVDATEGGVKLWRKPEGEMADARLRAAKDRYRHGRGDHLTLLKIYMSYRASLLYPQSASSLLDELLDVNVLATAHEARMRYIGLVTPRLGKSPLNELSRDDPAYWPKITRALCYGLFIQAAKRADPIIKEKRPGDQRMAKENYSRYQTVRLSTEVRLDHINSSLKGSLDETEWIIYHSLHKPESGSPRAQLVTAVTLEDLIVASPSYWAKPALFSGSIRVAVEEELRRIIG